MSRIRSIKPEFFMDDELASLPPLARLLFIALWTQADRSGRLKDKPTRIKAAALPYDDCDCEALLNDLARLGFIVRYEVGGRRYIEVVHFERHQRFNNENPSALPPRSDDYVSDSLPVDHGREGKGREGKGEESARAPEEDVEEQPPADDAPTPPSYAALPECFARYPRVKIDGIPLPAFVPRSFEAKYGMASPAKFGTFASTVRDGCLHGCDGNQRQACWCAEHIDYKIRNKSWTLLLRSMRSDREEAPREQRKR